MGRLLAIKLVKCIEKNVYWYKTLKEEVVKRQKRGEDPAPHRNATPYEPPPAVEGYEPPEAYLRAQRMQHLVSLEFLRHKRLHCAVSHQNLNNHTEEVTPKEQSYLRILSTCLVKHLVKKNQHTPIQATCGIATSLVADVLANTVLNPVINLFTPSTVNGWIQMAVEKSKAGAALDGADTGERRNKTTSEDDINSRIYNEANRMEPGRKPSFLGKPAADEGFRYFAGAMGETESSMLLSDKPPGAFLIRAAEDTIHMSYVSLSPCTAATADFYDDEEAAKKKSHRRFRSHKAGHPEPVEEDRFEKVRVAKARVLDDNRCTPPILPFLTSPLLTPPPHSLVAAQVQGRAAHPPRLAEVLGEHVVLRRPGRVLLLPPLCPLGWLQNPQLPAQGLRRLLDLPRGGLHLRDTSVRAAACHPADLAAHARPVQSPTEPPLAPPTAQPPTDQHPARAPAAAEAHLLPPAQT